MKFHIKTNTFQQAWERLKVKIKTNRATKHQRAGENLVSDSFMLSDFLVMANHSKHPEQKRLSPKLFKKRHPRRLHNYFRLNTL